LFLHVFHTFNTGRKYSKVRSFNFLASSYDHLQSQDYTVCVRREAGYCSIGWLQSDDPDSFKLSRGSSNYFSQLNGCATDRITILGGSNGGSESCISSTGPQPTVDRYCGGTLTCSHRSTSPSEVVSSRLPFQLGVSFNDAERGNRNNRGFCLNYRQILCQGS